jgi:hypothetical protein
MPEKDNQQDLEKEIIDLERRLSHARSRLEKANPSLNTETSPVLSFDNGEYLFSPLPYHHPYPYDPRSRRGPSNNVSSFIS